jgi:hypothetical protein
MSESNFAKLVDAFLSNFPQVLTSLNDFNTSKNSGIQGNILIRIAIASLKYVFILALLFFNVLGLSWTLVAIIFLSFAGYDIIVYILRLFGLIGTGTTTTTTSGSGTDTNGGGGVVKSAANTLNDLADYQALAIYNKVIKPLSLLPVSALVDFQNNNFNLLNSSYIDQYRYLNVFKEGVPVEYPFLILMQTIAAIDSASPSKISDMKAAFVTYMDNFFTVSSPALPDHALPNPALPDNRYDNVALFKYLDINAHDDERINRVIATIKSISIYLNAKIGAMRSDANIPFVPDHAIINDYLVKAHQSEISNLAAFMADFGLQAMFDELFLRQAQNFANTIPTLDNTGKLIGDSPNQIPFPVSIDQLTSSIKAQYDAITPLFHLNAVITAQNVEDYLLNAFVNLYKDKPRLATAAFDFFDQHLVADRAKVIASININTNTFLQGILTSIFTGSFNTDSVLLRRYVYLHYIYYINTAYRFDINDITGGETPVLASISSTVLALMASIRNNDYQIPDAYLVDMPAQGLSIIHQIFPRDVIVKLLSGPNTDDNIHDFIAYLLLSVLNDTIISDSGNQAMIENLLAYNLTTLLTQLLADVEGTLVAVGQMQTTDEHGNSVVVSFVSDYLAKLQHNPDVLHRAPDFTAIQAQKLLNFSTDDTSMLHVLAKLSDRTITTLTDNDKVGITNALRTIDNVIDIGLALLQANQHQITYLLQQHIAQIEADYQTRSAAATDVLTKSNATKAAMDAYWTADQTQVMTYEQFMTMTATLRQAYSAYIKRWQNYDVPETAPFDLLSRSDASPLTQIDYTIYQNNTIYTFQIVSSNFTVYQTQGSYAIALANQAIYFFQHFDFTQLQPYRNMLQSLNQADETHIYKIFLSDMATNIFNDSTRSSTLALARLIASRSDDRILAFTTYVSSLWTAFLDAIFASNNSNGQLVNAALGGAINSIGKGVELDFANFDISTLYKLALDGSLMLHILNVYKSAFNITFPVVYVPPEGIIRSLGGSDILFAVQGLIQNFPRDKINNLFSMFANFMFNLDNQHLTITLDKSWQNILSNELYYFYNNFSALFGANGTISLAGLLRALSPTGVVAYLSSFTQTQLRTLAYDLAKVADFTYYPAPSEVFTTFVDESDTITVVNGYPVTIVGKKFHTDLYNLFYGARIALQMFASISQYLSIPVKELTAVEFRNFVVDLVYNVLNSLGNIASYDHTSNLIAIKNLIGDSSDLENFPGKDPANFYIADLTKLFALTLPPASPKTVLAIAQQIINFVAAQFPLFNWSSIPLIGQYL